MKPEALRLADNLFNGTDIDDSWSREQIDLAASELRRLHEVNQELLEALKLMVFQFTKTPSNLKDSEARVKAHAAIAKADTI